MNRSKDETEQMDNLANSVAWAYTMSGEAVATELMNKISTKLADALEQRSDVSRAEAQLLYDETLRYIHAEVQELVKQQLPGPDSVLH